MNQKFTTAATCLSLTFVLLAIGCDTTKKSYRYEEETTTYGTQHSGGEASESGQAPKRSDPVIVIE